MNKLVTLTLSLALAGLSGQALAAGDPVAGQTKAATCVACHGADGNSTDPQFPRLAGQYADYLEQALQAYQDGSRQNPIMSGFAAGLGKQDIRDLAAYYAGQEGLQAMSITRKVAP
jgi:cytochrome c553